MLVLFLFIVGVITLADVVSYRDILLVLLTNIFVGPAMEMVNGILFTTTLVQMAKWLRDRIERKRAQAAKKQLSKAILLTRSASRFKVGLAKSSAQASGWNGALSEVNEKDKARPIESGSTNGRSDPLVATNGRPNPTLTHAGNDIRDEQYRWLSKAESQAAGSLSVSPGSSSSKPGGSSITPQQLEQLCSKLKEVRALNDRLG